MQENGSLSLSKRKRTHPSYETVKREMFVVPLPFGRARWTGVFDSNRTTRERERESSNDRRVRTSFSFSVSTFVLRDDDEVEGDERRNLVVIVVDSSMDRADEYRSGGTASTAAPPAEDRIPAFANEAIRFVQITSEDAKEELVRADLVKERSAFGPSFTHQVFEEEIVPGYARTDGLIVDVHFSSSLSAVHLSIRVGDATTEEQSTERARLLKERLSPFLPAEPTDDRTTFLKRCAADVAKPLGVVAETYHRNHEEFQIRLVTMGPNKLAEKTFHESLETFAVFFIDGASNIDSDDSRWECLHIWKRRKDRFELIGYMTLFTFTNPTRIECPSAMRICQALIFPPYQRCGHGTSLSRASSSRPLARTRP